MPLASMPPLGADWRERKGLSSSIEMNVTVLTTGFWPTYKVGKLDGSGWHGCVVGWAGVCCVSAAITLPCMLALPNSCTQLP